MTDFDWCCLGTPPLRASEDIWHAVRPQSPTTVCGLPVADPDEEWRWTDNLGSQRPCDNCTRILAQEEERPPGWKPKLGLLPRIVGDSAIPLQPRVGAPPPRPAEVHNIELDAADANMYGNDVWGDCVFVMIEKDRVISAEALGVSITKLTPTQVVKNYCDYNGIGTDPKVDAPGPGADILSALKWAQNHPERFGGSKLLFYGDFPITDEAAKEAVAEFGSICTGVTVYQAMEYPSKEWYLGARGKKLGGHGVAGGSYTPLANFLKTWGYEVSLNAAGFATIDELVVCVWDFQWTALTYDRQVELIAAYTFYTGKAWSGPAPVQPVPSPTPVPTPTGGNVVIKQYFPSAVFSIVGTIHGQKLNEMAGALTAGTTLTAPKPSSASAVARVTVNGVDYGLVVNGTFAGQLIPWALLTWQSGHEPIGPYK